MYSPITPIIRQLNAADYHDADNERRIASHRLAIDEGSDQDPDAEHQRARRQQDAEQARDPHGATENEVSPSTESLSLARP
jgi:hypothetical protein